MVMPMSRHERLGELKFEEMTDSRWDQPEATEKYPDGATAQRVIGDYVVRRYKPFSYWRVFASKHGSIPVNLQGVYTSAEEAQRAIEAFVATSA